MTHSNKPHSAHSVAHRMSTDIIKVNQNSTIADVLAMLARKHRKYKITQYIYVIDNINRLIGVLSLEDIFHHKKGMRIGKIMKREVVAISPDMDEEIAAHLALKHELHAVPVTKKGKLLGAVSGKTLLAIINHSLQKDILHFAGIHKSHLNYENTTKVPLFLSVLHRVPWLIVGLIGILIAAGVIGFFEAIINKYVILAFFIPAIMYMSSALGMQHQTLFIRDLAIIGKDLRIVNYFLRQTGIAFLIGLFISSLAFLSIFAIWQQAFVGFVISVSLLAALLVTNFTSLLTSLILYKSGRDPALGSGPFATVISDLTSVLIYFVIASWLLM